MPPVLLFIAPLLTTLAGAATVAGAPTLVGGLTALGTGVTGGLVTGTTAAFVGGATLAASAAGTVAAGIQAFAPVKTAESGLPSIDAAAMERRRRQVERQRAAFGKSTQRRVAEGAPPPTLSQTPTLGPSGALGQVTP